MHLQLFNPYKKFRDHKISFEYHKIDFTLDSNNKNKINTVDYKETYIDANKNLHSVVVSAATDMYINNNDSNKNVLLEFSRKISDRYYCILKAYNDYMEKHDKKNKTDNVTLTKIKNLNLNQILTTENKYLIQTIKDNVTCDGASNKYFGNAGSTPQTWILYFENKFIGQENFIEFRHRLFFVYKLMGFMNSCIQNEILIKELNKIIKSKYNLNMDDWCINVEYAQYLNHRCENAKKKIPVYKTGPAASLNVFLRQGIDNDNIYLERKNNLDIASYQDIADKKSHSYSPKLFDVVISEREAMALTGDLKKDIRNTPNSKRPISYISGALTYEYISNPANKDAQKYLEIAKELCLPIICGISGTMDYSLSMAALVFLGIKNKKQDLEYQNIIKLAYITWMSIGYDHTLHEMLFSATSYGIPYIPGPYIVDYIYPNDIDFKLKIEEKLKEIGLDLPSNILKDFILTKNITNSIVGKSIFALESIAKCSGIVRMVPMQQIKDEVYNLEFPNIRHLGRKSVGTKDRTKIYDPSTQLTSTRTVNSNRFTNKNTEFTKKMCTTLLRPDGNMTVYKCTENIGFIYNLHALKNKGWKYVFRQNAITDAKWWLGDHNSDRAQNGAYFIKIDQLRSNLLKNAKFKAKADLFNELLLGLSKNALLGLFIRQDENYSSLDERSIFNIIIGYLSIRYQLKLNLPIFHFDNPKTSINKNNNENRIKVLTLEFFIDFLLNQRNLNNQKKQKNQSSKISASDLSQIYSYIWGINITENSKKYKEIESLSMDEFKRKLNKKLEGAFVLEKDKLKIEKFYIDTLNKMFQFYSNQSFDVLINKTSPDKASINASISSSSYSLSSNLPASGSSLNLPPPPPSLLRSKSKIVPITSPNDASQIIFDTNTEVTHSNLPKFLFNEELKKVLS